MEARLNKAQILRWLDDEEDEFYIDRFRSKYGISPESSVFHTTISRLVDDRKYKRLGRGLYRRIKQVKPVRWFEADETEYYDFRWPFAPRDNSGFGFEEMINVSPGDLIVVAGVGNYGKSCFVLNILGMNLDLHDCLLMGNEYTAMGDRPSPKFKRRMLNMKWVNWLNGSGEPKFILLPVKQDYEDYVQRGKLNIIDWVNLTNELWKIGEVMETIKNSSGKGVAVVVQQKDEKAEFGRGRRWSEDFADVYLTIDPFGKRESRLTVGKVKDYKEWVTGRMWAFTIVDRGANLHNIREIVKCPQCYGKGWKKSGVVTHPCDNCIQKGYVDL